MQTAEELSGCFRACCDVYFGLQMIISVWSGETWQRWRLV